MGDNGKTWRNLFTQEWIVTALAAVSFIVFSILVPTFHSPSNIVSLLQNVSVLGIIAIGMAMTIIGRGIDLSVVATLVIAVAWLIVQMNNGVPASLALIRAIVCCVVVGLVNGVVIAYLEVPPIFATLAMASIVYGFGKVYLISSDVNYLGDNWKWLTQVAISRPFNVPVPVITFSVVALVAHLFLKYTSRGRFIYACGDNPATARITGISVRTLALVTYALAALIAFVGGILMALVVSSMNTRVASSTLVYDVILVTVLGGVALSGGRGGIKSVVVGTVLIGTLLNGMTMLDLNNTAQNMIKALMLLSALVIDALVNPRDEQTGHQGDI